MKQKIGGIIVPLITPFIRNKKGKFTIDEKASNRLIDNLISNGIGAIFIFGYAGGCTKKISIKQRKIHLINVLKQVKHRIPVIVGVSHDNLEYSADLAKHAEKAGADAIVLLLNHGNSLYHKKVNFILKSTNKIPLILYNNPFNGLMKNLTAKKLRIIFLKHATRIIGLKESSGNESIFRSFIDFQKEVKKLGYMFLLFMGEATKIKWIVHKQKEFNFKVSGIVPVECNIPERVPLYKNLLMRKKARGIEYLSISEVIKYLIKNNCIDQASLEFWNI